MNRIKKRYMIMANSDSTLPPDPPERYILDQLTLDELGSVFTWAQMMIDAQMDQESADEVEAEVDAAAAVIAGQPEAEAEVETEVDDQEEE